MIVKNTPIANGATIDSQFRFPGLNLFKNRELETTDTELNAIAKPASSGFKTNPIPTKRRAAIGIPKTL